MTARPAPARPAISARIGAIAESATLAVDAKAKALKAAGRPVIGFGAGEPDFPTPDYIVEAAVAACRDPRYHRYTPAGGLPELQGGDRGEDAARLGLRGRRRRRCWSPTAASRRVYEAFATLLDPGDEVLLPAPYWTTYPEAIRLAGGVPVEVVDRRDDRLPASPSSSSRPRAPSAPRCCCSCSPSNPTGAVYPPDAGRGDRPRGRVEHGIWVVTDEIYEHLVYGDAEFASMPVAGARARRPAASSSTASPRPTR